MKRLFLFLGICTISLLSAQNMKMKDYRDILTSRNIYEINAFLRDAHPDDPRRAVLKPKVMKMMREYIQNAHPADQRVKELQEMLALLKRRPSTKISFDEMNQIIKQKQIARYKEELEKSNHQINSGAGNTASSYMSYALGGSAPVGSAPSGGGTSSGTAYVDPEADEFTLLMSETAVEHKNKTTKILNSLFDNDPNSKESIIMIENKSDCNIIVRIEGTGSSKFRLAVPSKKENSIVVPKGNYLFTSLVCGADYASQKTVEKAIMVSLGNPSSMSSTAK